MSVSLIGLLTAAFGFMSALRSTLWAIAAVLSFSLLGAASAFSFGTANITPGHLAIGFLLVAVFIRPNQRAKLMKPFQIGMPGLFLIAVVFWAVASAVIMPRLFEGQVLVLGQDSKLSMLGPSSYNLNQTVYFLSGPIIFALVAAAVHSARMLDLVVRAVIAVSALNLFLALVDVATAAVGLESLLSFVRNAEYDQHFGQRIMGIKRVTGVLPEPAAFAGLSAMLFAFNFTLWRAGIHSTFTGWISLLTFVAIVFTFSSTGYVALFVFLSFAYFFAFSGFERRPQTAQKTVARNRNIFLSLIPVGALVGAIFLAVRPDLLEPIEQLFDITVSSKLQSESGEARTRWNMEGLRVFYETYGLGAGAGSARTSSFPISILANLGIVGALLFALFFFSFFTTKTEEKNPLIQPNQMVYASAARAACFVNLIAALLVGVSIDLGIYFYTFAGLACATVYSNSRPAVQLRYVEQPGFEQQNT